MGHNHACALLSDSTVKCWGYGYYGQLGYGSTSTALTPVSVTGLSGVASVEAGGSHTCAVLSGGGMKCWGSNSYGQLGINNATTIYGCLYAGTFYPTFNESTCSFLGGTWTTGSSYGNELSAVTVTGLSGVSNAMTGQDHTCARISDGTVKCWGRNSNGQLGQGAFDNNVHYTPTTVPSLTGVATVKAEKDASCAILTNATAKCWGANHKGQLGAGAANLTSPTTLPGLSNITDIAGGFQFTCVSQTDGTAQCLGKNQYGQLGNGTTTDSSSPVLVNQEAAIAGLPATVNVTVTDSLGSVTVPVTLTVS